MSDFPHDNETPIGETKKIAEEEGAYAASQEPGDADEPARKPDHALGGSEGTTDGT
ncbi:hypothetical protein ACQ7HM_06190 [Williamsia sp. MIQD14]|uniref:hypothetical protein n=1 Tax=Williamsia sp. MIQD14 TaxID=3425703 RepID=UPI003DA05073